MHLIVPFAAPFTQAGRDVMKHLHWPVLARALATADIGPPHRGGSDEEWSLSPPHERALADALDWDAADGLVPLARLMARDDGVVLDPNDARGIALVTPAHWHLGTEQLSLGDPSALMLDAAASRECFDIVSPLFTSEGFEALHGAPGRWYLRHASLATLPTASLDRVIGRNVDRWLGAAPEARLLRRLQNEAQMLLHGHAFNAERERRGLLAVNSLWISGGGPALPLPAREALPRVNFSLRHAALSEDWRGWFEAWQRLDHHLGELPWSTLTLCGERGWRRITRSGDGALARLRAKALAWRRVNIAALLEAL